MILSWVFAFMVVCNAWMSDDAFISFRSVDSFINGFGLRFNVVERVQTYTNPLLVIVLIPIHFVFHRFGEDAIYYESLGFSFFLLIVFLFVLKRIFSDSMNYSVALLLLCTNIPILDYFTSGLENSLNFILISILILAFKKDKTIVVSAISGLLVLSRLDLVFLVLPLVIFNSIIKKKSNWLIQLVLFSMPAFIWVTFSLVYYGSVLPNSVIAKSAFDPTTTSVIYNSFNYLRGILYFHPIALILPMYLLFALQNFKSLKLGVILYFMLPFIAGGDFMSGRFQTVISILLILLLGFKGAKISRIKPILILSVVLFFVHPNSLFVQAFQVTSSNAEVMKFKIADEKQFYFGYTSLVRRVIYQDRIGEYRHALEGKNAGKSNVPTVKKYSMAGFCGYYCPRNVYLTDKIGIVDPLLARLPSESNEKWRPGHPFRRYPKGYIESLKLKENLIENEEIKRLYNDILLATRSKDLFAKERWAAIWRLNTGYHKIERGYE